jgi:uncharacterized protein YcfJ
MPKKTSHFMQIAIGVAVSVLSVGLVGGIAFANEMENRTQALEITAKTQAETIRDQRQKVKDLGAQVSKIDKMVTFLAVKAGWSPQ